MKAIVSKDFQVDINKLTLDCSEAVFIQVCTSCSRVVEGGMFIAEIQATIEWYWNELAQQLTCA